MRIIAVAGARPNFMKIAPLMWGIGRRADLDVYLVHTGQHYDERMSRLFFEELNDLAVMPGLIVVELLDHLDFMKLVSEARLVLTDSGGFRRRRRSWACPA